MQPDYTMWVYHQPVVQILHQTFGHWTNMKRLMTTYTVQSPLSCILLFHRLQRKDRNSFPTSRRSDNADSSPMTPSQTPTRPRTVAKGHTSRRTKGSKCIVWRKTAPATYLTFKTLALPIIRIGMITVLQEAWRSGQNHYNYNRRRVL